MVVALLLLTAVGYFRGPASALAALHDAARARDSAAVAGLIDGEALRHDDEFLYVGAWEFTGTGEKPVLHKEQLVYQAIELKQRSYK